MNMSKMTKGQLIQLLAVKDQELLALRSTVSQLRGDRENSTRVQALNAVGEPTSVLLHRARDLSVATGICHRVFQGRLESFDKETRTWL